MFSHSAVCSMQSSGGPGSEGGGNAAGERSYMNLSQEEQGLLAIQTAAMMYNNNNNSEQGDQLHTTATMDEFLENIISIPPWPEAIGFRSQWDFNASTSHNLNTITTTTVTATAAATTSNTNNSDQAALRVHPHQVDDPHAMIVDHSATNLVDVVEAHAWSSSHAFVVPVDPSSAKKRHRDEDPQLHSSGLSSQAFGAMQISSPTSSSQPQQVPSYQPDATPPPPPPPAAQAGVTRSRVRARRGQATDPHSIAERLRRERIAERMKALQELVPNANKTDKASMLDEIIDYVKFLQLQVKVLSMSRLGGLGGTTSSLVADLPSEAGQNVLSATASRGNIGQFPPEGIALTERQVARLMEEDMGSAMQYLQSRGLCLMPIALAASVSTGSKLATTTTSPVPLTQQPAEPELVASTGAAASSVDVPGETKRRV